MAYRNLTSASQLADRLVTAAKVDPDQVQVTSQKHQPGGYAPLDFGGRVPVDALADRDLLIPPDGFAMTSCKNGTVSFAISLAGGGQYTVTWPDGSVTTHDSATYAGKAFTDTSPKLIRVQPTSPGETISRLYIQDNDVVALDVGNLADLTQLRASDNRLTGLQINHCTNLDTLNVHTNQLTRLDVAGLANLNMCLCENNPLVGLEVTGCTGLTFLDCPGGSLTQLDVSSCTLLSQLTCHDNDLVTLTLSPAVQWLHCQNNQLAALDLTGCAAIRVADLQNNQLTTLDITGLQQMTRLDVSGNQLTSLTATGYDGASYFSSPAYLTNLSNNALSADALAGIFGDLASADPAPSWIDIAANPGTGQDGSQLTWSQIAALATGKGYSLITTG